MNTKFTHQKTNLLYLIEKYIFKNQSYNKHNMSELHNRFNKDLANTISLTSLHLSYIAEIQERQELILELENIRNRLHLIVTSEIQGDENEVILKTTKRIQEIIKLLS